MIVLGYVHPGTVTSQFTESLTGFIGHDAQNRKILHSIVSVQSGPRIAAARNDVVRRFLSTGAEWLLMVDTDMVFSAAEVYRLADHADAVERPFMGALCFGGGRSGNYFPTMYRLVRPETANDSVVQIIEDYPADAICKVDATGAAFALMHRNMLLAIAERHGEPAPFYVEGSIYKTLEFGEDWALCMRAKDLGYSVHVDTSVKVGHVKAVVVDEAMYRAYRAEREVIGEGGIRQRYMDRLTGAERQSVPSFAVIPQRGHVDLTEAIVRQLANQGGCQILVIDNGSDEDEIARTKAFCHELGVTLEHHAGNIHEMWNRGIEWAQSRAPVANLAILNNDIAVGPHFIKRLATALRADDDLLAVCPNYDGRKGSGVLAVQGIASAGGMCGFAFMVRAEAMGTAVPLFDTDFHWWFGDAAFTREVAAAGRKVGLVHLATVEHLDGGSKTAGHADDDEVLAARIARDRKTFERKWAQ